MSPKHQLGEKIRAYCSSCEGERNCEIKGYYPERGSDADEHYHWSVDWFLLVCCGCDHAFAQTISSDSESYHHYYDRDGQEAIEAIESVNTWPARSKREVPEWFKHGTIDTDLPDTGPLDASLKELYGALNNELRVLASIGIRTSFDITAGLLGIDPEKRFHQKLDDLVAQGHITAADKEHVEVLVDAGSASAHRGWRPKLDDLGVLMKALENFIYSSIVLPARKRTHDEELAKVKKRVPPKKAAKRDSAKADTRRDAPAQQSPEIDLLD